MSDLAWPTAAELDANPALWSRWWWVNGAPERLGVDRMTYPARVTWRARFVDELPVEWFGGMVATAEEVDKQAARIAELEAHIDKGRRPHCHHIGFGEHAPFHGAHTIGHGLPDDEARLSPEETEIERLEKENTILAARIAELEAPGECASIHKLQAKLSEMGAQHDIHKERASALERQLAEVQRSSVPLAPTHTGMRVSAVGVLERVRPRAFAEYVIDSLQRMASSVYSGDLATVDAYLQALDLDQDRPKAEAVKP